MQPASERAVEGTAKGPSGDGGAFGCAVRLRMGVNSLLKAGGTAGKLISG